MGRTTLELIVVMLLFATAFGCQVIGNTALMNGRTAATSEFPAEWRFGAVEIARPEVDFRAFWTRRENDRPPEMFHLGKMSTLTMKHSSGQMAEAQVGLRSTNEIQQIGFLKRKKHGGHMALITTNGRTVGKCIWGDGKMLIWSQPRAEKPGQSKHLGYIQVGGKVIEIDSVLQKNKPGKKRIPPLRLLRTSLRMCTAMRAE